MTSETLNRYNSTTPLVTKKFKINVFLKKVLGVYFVKNFKVKMAFFAFFKSISAGNKLFWRHFVHSGRLGRLIWLLWLPPLPPTGHALPLPIVGTPHSFWVNLVLAIALSKWRCMGFRLWLAWRRDSLSPIGRLKSNIQLLAAWQCQFILLPSLGLKGLVTKLRFTQRAGLLGCRD